MSPLITEALTDGRFIFWGAITLICVVPSICHYWYRIRRHELDAQLKHSMIEQGMSADDITRVLSAGSKPAKDEAN